jgi:hypothetical protein
MSSVDNRKLQSVYGFSEIDLAANQRGELTMKQIRALKSRRSFGLKINIVVTLISFALFGGGGLLIYFGAQNSSQILTVIGMTLVGIGGVMLWLQLGFGSPRSEAKLINQDVRARRVEQFSGVVQRATQAIPIGQSNQTVYFLRLGDLTPIRVMPDEYEAFSDNQCYRVYYLPQSRVIVAAENIAC